MKQFLSRLIKLFIYLAIIYLALVGFVSIIGKNETQSDPTQFRCNRTEPYKLVPEFERARSLRVQRIEQAGGKLNKDWTNCINIVYDSLPDAEGMFYFDKDSSLDNLTIFVDNRYKSSDDLLTSILLHHEFTHIGQFIEQITTGKEMPCFDSEKKAFRSQLEYLLILNEEEINSLDQRIYALSHGGYNNKKMESAVGMIDDLVKIMNSSQKYCNSLSLGDNSVWTSCVWDKTDQLIGDYVRSNPNYIDQCKD